MLSVKELEKKSLEKAKVNHDTYKHIYTMVSNQIRRQHDTGNTRLLYTVPSFIVGRTPFRHHHAIRYTVEKLQKGGFDVTTDSGAPGILLIDWTPKPKPKPKPKRASKPKPKPKPKPISKAKDTVARKKIEEPLHVRIARLQSKSIMNA